MGKEPIVYDLVPFGVTEHFYFILLSDIYISGFYKRMMAVSDL